MGGPRDEYVQGGWSKGMSLCNVVDSRVSMCEVGGPDGEFVCVHGCVRACVHACVCACVRACVRESARWVVQGPRG